MKTSNRIIDKLSGLFGIMAGFLMLIGVMLTLTEVVMRSIFNSTIYITQEYSGYFMAAITFFGLAYTLKEKGHIRLTFMHRIIKPGKGRVILDMYTFILGLLIFAVVTYATFNFFLGSLKSGTQSLQITKTYLAIPQAVMPLGSLLITLQFLSEILKSIVRLQTGDFTELDEDQVEAEVLGR